MSIATKSQSPNNGVSRYHALRVLLRPYRHLLLAAVALGVIDQLLALAAGGLGAYLVGRAAVGASVQELRPGIVVLAALVIPKPVTAWLESFVAHDLAYRLLVDLRTKLYGAIERLSPAYLLEHRSGELGATALSDVELVELFFAHFLSPLIVAVIVPVAALAALAVINPLIALALLPALIAMATIPLWLRRRAATQGQQVRNALGDLNAEVVDRIQGLREVVMFGDQDRQLRRLDRAGGRVGTALRAHAGRAGSERGLLDGLGSFGLLGVVAVAATLVADHTVAPAAYPYAVVLAGYAFVPIITVLTTARELGNVAGAGERILRLLNATPPVVDPVNPLPMEATAAEVRFDAVTFSYTADADPAVSDLDFVIPAGSTVALVGHSGAGKSTCAALLMRWWDPHHGRITIGGRNLRHVAQSDLHRTVSLVPQDTYLFNVSVADNIRLGRPDATQTEVEAAATAAMAHDFIVNDLPWAYDTVVGERGTQLSGGQRQRIAIARALLADAPILVLDEAVSNIDAESDAALDKAMTAVRNGRTTLVIAHRRSTIQAADTVVLLDHGRVIDHGTDPELSTRNPTYRNLLDLD